MSSNEIVIDVRSLTKRYEIYATPRDRLKQIILPSLQNIANRIRLVFGVSKRWPLSRYFREFYALNDISFQVRRGETLGIIGRNGGGKSTLLQILAGTLSPTSGEAIVTGRVAALLELGSGFNPEFTGRENVFLNGQILGLTQKEIKARYDQIAEFADIGEFIDQPVKTYSSGMFLRLAFAVQAHVDASIVVIDEALAVGDVFFRQKCYARLEQLKKSGAAILLVSHSMPDIEQFCERAVLLHCGTMRFIGSAAEAAKHYYLLNQSGPRTEAITKGALMCGSQDNFQSGLVSRPASEAFINLSNKTQVNNGQALCVGAALCDVTGEPRNFFQQGEKAVFYFEFELSMDIGVPICGVLIRNERGIIVHGKNSWQLESDIPLSMNRGRKVICRQEISLQLAVGEYSFEIGLAAIPQSDWDNRERISHEEWAARYSTVCVVTDAGQFSIGFSTKNNVPVLTHHGVADLPGKMSLVVTK